MPPPLPRPFPLRVEPLDTIGEVLSPPPSPSAALCRLSAGPLSFLLPKLARHFFNKSLTFGHHAWAFPLSSTQIGSPRSDVPLVYYLVPHPPLADEVSLF